MSELNQDFEEWSACPTGELQRTVRRIRARRRDRQLSRAVGATGALAIVLLAGAVLVQLLNGEISCREVQVQMRDFIAGNLDVDQARRINEHLAKCATCREGYEQMTPRADSTARRLHKHASATTCPDCRSAFSAIALVHRL